MKNLKVYLTVIENGELSEKALYEYLKDYSENANQIAKNLLNNSELKGDYLADEFFNSIDEETILSFQNGDNQNIVLSLGRYHDLEEENGDEKHEFGACYLYEIRNSDYDLEYADSYELGEENKLIEELEKLGLNLKEA